MFQRWLFWPLFTAILGFVLGGSASWALYAPTIPHNASYHQKAQHTPDTGSPLHKPKESFWERATDDPVAVFTLALVVFTFVLAISTIGLWIVTWLTSRRQSRDTKILQRAYVSVQPEGVRKLHNPAETAHASIVISNRGNLPARNVSWVINQTFCDTFRLHHFPIDENDAEGSNVISPGNSMIQGGSPFPAGVGAFTAPTGGARFLYVWGAIFYDDGFEMRRTTGFCHRYNCVNYSGGAIGAGFGRLHRYGNEAD